MTSSKKNLTCPSCVVTPKKFKTETSQFFIECTRLFGAFEQLSSSVGWQVTTEYVRTKILALWDYKC